MINQYRANMAGAGGRKPPDKPVNNFCCHKLKPSTTAVCTICEEEYHHSCLTQKYNNYQFIGKNLIICPEHTGLNITSKTEENSLNDSARLLIAQIKLKKKEDLRKELLEETTSKIQEFDETDSSNEESDYYLIKTENLLLKQLVNELTDKNELLKEKLERNLKESDKKTLTYSEAVNLPKPQQKKMPKITVKNTSDSNIDIKAKVIECLTMDKKIQTNKLHVKNKNELIISCVNSDSVDQTEFILKENLDGLCNIVKEELNNPKIKIVGIDNYTNMTEQDIEKDINERNFSRVASKGKVLHMYKSTYNDMSTVLMEVTAELYKLINENKYKIFVGHQNCKVYDLINIRPCNKCGRYGHNVKKCTNTTMCLKCAEAHKTSDCVNTIKKCLNCDYSNCNYKTNLETNHYAEDSNLCSILKKKINRYIDTTDYPMRPTLPSVNIALHRQKVTNRQSNLTTITASVPQSQQDEQSASGTTPQDVRPTRVRNQPKQQPPTISRDKKPRGTKNTNT